MIIVSQYVRASNHHTVSSQLTRVICQLHLSSVQSLSRVPLFVTPWTAARQASLSITNSWSLLKLRSVELVMPSSHLISVVPFSSCPQSFLAAGSFLMNHISRLGRKRESRGPLAGLAPAGPLWTFLVPLDHPLAWLRLRMGFPLK